MDNERIKNPNAIIKRETMPDLDPVLDWDDDSYVEGYYAGSPETSERQQLNNAINVLRKRWLLIMAVTVIGTLTVIAYETQKSDYYSADARIQVDNETNPAVGTDKQSSIILSSGNDPAYFTTQLQILEGPGLIRRVVKTLDLEHNPTFFKPGRGQEASSWQNAAATFGLSSRSVARVQTIPDAPTGEYNFDLKAHPDTETDGEAEELAPYVEFIRRGLSVSPVKDTRTTNKETRLIKVEYTHYDPAMATKIVNTIADTYVLQNLEAKVESNLSASDFLQKRVAELQSEIRTGEEHLINYAKDHQIVSLDSSQNTVVQRLSDLNVKLSGAENERINAEAAYRAALQNPMNNASAETKDSRTAALQQQLTQLRQQLNELKVEYTDEWPEVKKVQRQIASIEGELKRSKKMSTDIQLASLEQGYREAASRERELRSSFEAQRAAVLNQNEAAINYRIIQQEVDTNKTLLNSLLQRSRETEVVLNGTPNNVRIVDRALAPTSPDGPHRTKNVLIALLASIFLGVGLAFGLNWLDDSVRPTDNLETQLGIPVIGLIPGAASSLPGRLMSSRLRRLNHRKIGRDTYPVEAFAKPMLAEAFHQLRTSLLLSTSGGAPKTILVTSGHPSEGKTVTSLGLAKSLAQLDGRVLLMDCDLRCPKMHILNDVANESGLSSLLAEDIVDSDSIDRVVRRNIHNNLDLLPSGPKVFNPVNLISSVQMRSLLERLGTVYSHIVIDSSPILYFADSVILSTEVDAVVMVARANYTTHPELLRAKKKMQDVRGNVVGIVLNDIPASNYGYHNSGYYHQLQDGEAEEEAGSVLHLQ